MLPISNVARAAEVEETQGFLKAIVDTESRRILGFTALALEGGDFMAAMQTAMMGQLPFTALRGGIFGPPDTR